MMKIKDIAYLYRGARLKKSFVMIRVEIGARYSISDFTRRGWFRRGCDLDPRFLIGKKFESRMVVVTAMHTRN
jgi:hypothetical protein